MLLKEFIQLALFITLIIVCAKPVGLYLYDILESKEPTFLDPVLRPLENFIYRICRINPDTEQHGKEYLFCILGFSLISFLFTAIILAAQG